MNFLEAHKIVKDFKSEHSLSFQLASSGMIDNLDIFMQAHAALCGHTCQYNTLPFNTLQQTVRTPAADDRPEIFVLMPWDFLPELDWRSGLAINPISIDHAYDHITNFARQLQLRVSAQFIYIDAAIPPIFPNHIDNNTIKHILINAAKLIGATLFDHSVFSLSGYLNQGHPFSGKHADQLANAIISAALKNQKTVYKVLITDLDNVLWHGVIAEDGLDNIHYHPEGLGFRHFIYQTFLKELKRRGILLVAVSRNDLDVALTPFKQNDMALKEHDFITIIASYEAKSSQIKAISERLNLPLNTFIFVDDNTLEIAEVSTALPEVICKLFPGKDDMLPTLLSELAILFSRETLTDEDLQKTKLYKQRLKGLVPSHIEGSDLNDFLLDLNMTLSIEKKQIENCGRAIQLINKTNQFNLNGVRTEKHKIDTILSDGGHLFTASLSDKHGSHGEVLACLINQKNEIISFVMSCRIFQRHAEYAFLSWISTKLEQETLSLNYTKTDRNTPIQNFLNEDSFHKDANEKILLTCAQFIDRHKTKLKLFCIESK